MRKVVATTRSLMTGIGLMLVFLLVSSAPALASQERPYTGVSFGPEGTGAGTFANVQGVTVDQTSGDVFVYDDGGGGRVYKFDAAGEPVDFSGLGTNAITGVGGAYESEEEVAVDSSSGPDAGDVYAANNSEVKIYSAAGALLGTLSGGEMCGVAVDASGAVYVGIYGGGGVRKYVPTANPVTNANEVSSLGGVRGICNVAADSEGNLYAAQYSGGITRYPALQFGSPIPSGTLIDGSGQTLAVDQSSNALYVNERSAIAEYDASGNLIGTSASGKISGSFGVGVDSAKNELYVPNEGRVMAFGPAVLIPTVSGGGASEITSSSATIGGSVNPEGTATTYQFQYGTTTSYGSVSPASPQSVGSDSSTHEVSTQLTGLAPDTEYHYRLSAIGTNGTSYGPDGTFKTGGPPEVIYELLSSLKQSTVLVGAYIEPNKLDTHYQVEYGPSESYGSTTSLVDMGASARQVTQELNGLQTSTTYHYRFVATNSEGTVHGSDQTVSTAPAARIESESISGATSTEAAINARADVFGAKSTYYFDYGTTSAYGDATPEQAFSTEAQAALVGLSPETTYHFRVVIKNQYGTIEGEDKTFTTFPTPRLDLPDNRGYEKVSPNNNADGNVYAAWAATGGSTAGGWTERPYEAASNGDALAYVGMPSGEGGTGKEGGGAGNQYLARRLADGDWRAENVTPPAETLGTEPVYQGFSADLSHGFLTTNANIPLIPGAPAEEYHVPYVRDFETGAYETLLSSIPPHRGTYEFGAYETAKLGKVDEREPVFAGSSADLSHVLFMANDALTANAVDGGVEDNNLYDFHDGALTLVNVLPNGSPEPGAVYGGPVREPDERWANGPDFSHVISEDGARIFWTGQEANPNIYMREDDARTVQVDASVGGGGQYRTATPDGSKVLFTKNGDLYEYEVESGQTTDLTPGGEVQGIVGTSEDLSYVYVVANAVLAPGGEQGACPYGGECGLYVLHAGEPARFIAMLSKHDNFKGLGSAAYEGDWQEGLADKEAQVTPDGRQVLFGSVQSLTGYDNNYKNEYHESRKDEELFVYEFEGSKLRCVSCNRSGESPTDTISAYLPVSHQNTYTRRWMSNDGSRVFFNSLDPLVSQDTNGLNDVYEWERDGSGSCTSSEGCIYLLTGGTGGEGAYLVDSSASGDDVFFTSRAQLVPEDQNENIDVYDAHVGAIAPPAQPQCTGTGCQGLPSAPPVFSTPSSVTYNGVGNFAPVAKVAPKTGKAKTKKKSKKKRKQGKRSKKAKKSTRDAKRKGHGSSARKSAATYGRSK